jgi:MFS family permease
MSPAHLQNPRWFILFRLLFNCRFYYPIYTIFFLDAGLSMDQFATLNFIWALSIVLLEVPSGAFADVIGRRRLIVLSAVLMVLEMACLAFLPFHAGPLTFWVFAVNRVLSGAAEACASGADEALTYDSLPEDGREDAWRALQARLMRWNSLGFMLAMLSGAFLYEAGNVNKLLGWLGMSSHVTASQAMRIPVVLCFLMALACLAISLKFAPAPGEKTSAKIEPGAMRKTFAGIAETGGWILRSPVALGLLVVGLCGDSFMRLFYTIGSQFYRTIDIPTTWNGPIGAIASLSGMAFAPIIAGMSKHWSSKAVYALLGVLIFVGFAGLAYPVKLWGVLAAIPFWFGMRLLHFNLSVHLNAAIPAEKRATALSFRGLSMNLAYGLVMQSFGWQALALGKSLPGASTDAIFTAAMPAWAWVFLGIAVAVGVLFGRKLPAKAA